MAVAASTGRPVSGSLTADLYAGTAGVGLALAEVAAATADAACRRTAIGALRHAGAHADRVPPGLDAGFHGGTPGIALACRRGGVMLGCEELVAVSDELGRRIVSRPRWPAAHDLIGGRAGGIVALLGLAGSQRWPAHRATALRLGDSILSDARSRGAWSWPQDGPGTGLSPSGMSHGPAGVAFALGELDAAADDDRFARAAASATAWEDRVRDGQAGNWLTRSEDSDRRRPGGLAQTSFMHWCHGAPGIGLARFRAWQLGGGDARRRDAAACLDLTARWVRAALAAGPGDFSLCHGLGGLAEVLRDVAPADPVRSADHRALAADVATAGIDEFARRGRPWPCGGPGGEAPALMTGLAGIARFYLRAAEPTLPSVLLPVPTAWSEPAGAGQGAPAASAAAALIRP